MHTLVQTLNVEVAIVPRCDGSVAWWFAGPNSFGLWSHVSLSFEVVASVLCMLAQLVKASALTEVFEALPMRHCRVLELPYAVLDCMLTWCAQWCVQSWQAVWVCGFVLLCCWCVS